MIASSESPCSARTGLTGGGRTVAAVLMTTVRGSSSNQFASSLLISPSEFSPGLIAIARSCDPSPLKSPTAYPGREESGVAALSKTRATVSRISVGLGGVEGLSAGVALGAGDANANNLAGGSTEDSTGGAGSLVVPWSFRVAQADNRNAVASKARPNSKALVLLHYIGKVLLA